VDGWGEIVQITELQIHHLRCLSEVTLAPSANLNLLLGANGAGKTSVLEALHLLAYGRSFRGRVRDGLVQGGHTALEVFIRWNAANGRQHRAGLRHDGQGWTARLDGESVKQLGDLLAAVMVVTFEPGSHALMSGSGEARRRFLDWGLFHVEQDFLPLWRRYARALKQRNALLKTDGTQAQIEAWDRELADSGERLDGQRQRYLQRLDDSLAVVMARLAPGLGASQLAYSSGWRREAMPLADALLLARERDRKTGFTSVGPHRGDWRLSLSALAEGAVLSRGQAKLAALACLMAQAADCAAHRDGDWPVIVLDDLAAELDRPHRARVLEFLRESAAQVFISGTETPDDVGPEARLFHVEQGRVGQGVAHSA